MLGSVLSLWLITSTAALVEAAPAGSSADEEADLSEAKRLFDEGTARYEAADFAGAIEVFTLALSELRNQGIDDFAIRGLLLFNIGRTHMRAYEIDGEVEHLRQAETIFTSFVEASERYPDQVSQADVEEARAQLEEIERLLADASDGSDEGTSASNPTSAAGDTGEDTGTERSDPRRLKASGIGLSVAGGVLVAGGVGMLVWGAGYGPVAQREVAQLDTLGLPPDSPAFADGEAHVASEKRKGAAWMAAGGVSAALGVAGLAVGIQRLVKAKRLRERAITPTAAFGPEGVWLGVGGRF